MVLLLPIFCLLRRVPDVYERIFCKHFIEKSIDKIYYILFWNSTFRYIIEGYLALTLESISFMNKGLDWTTALN